MEDEFRANILLVNIEKEIGYEDVLEHFTGAKRQRVDL
jgi:hypothetical protein